MALTPFLAQFGGKLGQMLEKSDMKALQVGRIDMFIFCAGHITCKLPRLPPTTTPNSPSSPHLAYPS